ncbi:probable alpha-ketoglutarate-dependent hypophosphite dioxygenase [Neodiprion pinetum]|uniref:phytanoyl-CoA dioxygenase n=1 Tax=Neodiprion lecontei TaxID=441921 RepID=A0A6J0BWY3_NEOLC|nr:probable alpha-ketoglutarate-dependent hypophosphite dioxygenase [Neodiprion lecontei]XP_046433956.1 probable alpha-ketoglutarate-dependent hypophosphite dioxygenase [Neodiprion fabricii]XP_046492063.1 probable alpha-ketoglutarate-dependent hypophosphite dioxygenase [Neodiprion pinetum]XP_046628542.1 probable alpha-ketoglutarate-dependent hypophosphite dioxygenase [Neodiprion virginianus]
MGVLKYLKPEDKEFYEKNGFIKLSGIFSEAEMEEISQEYNELFERKTRENLEGLESAWSGDRVKQEAGFIDYTVKAIHNLQMHSSVFTRVIMNSKLLDAMEDVLGTPDVLLHHTKAHIKPPENGAPYLMHQDYPYFPFKNHTMVAVFLHLDDTTPENGGLAVYPGSHKLGPLADKGITDEQGEQYHWVDQNKWPLKGATPISAKKGEVIVFSYLLLHGSYLNLSDRARRMFLLQLRAADDEPTRACHQSPAQNLVLRGRNVHRSANMATRFAD